MRLKHLLWTLVITPSALMAETSNPANRYLEEYKNHLAAECPIGESDIKHFVYFSRDRAAIRKHSMLKHSRISGAQIMYSWRELEPEKSKYDFTTIEEDLAYLAKHKKQLFVQLQDTTFHPKYKAVPNYLIAPEYAHGVANQYGHEGKLEGSVAKRWNPSVQKRFALLLKALGKQFDGRVEGINLQETAIQLSDPPPGDYSDEGYADGIKANMLALKQSFPNTVGMQYANFMPGEWLPWEDKGYLKSIYTYGENIGIGLAAPDLMFRRKGQLNHALAMMHEGDYSVPMGIAIQDGNYIGQTGNLTVKKNRKNIVPQLYSFAKHFLGVDYLFWSNQKPYFTDDVVPCLTD